MSVAKQVGGYDGIKVFRYTYRKLGTFPTTLVRIGNGRTESLSSGENQRRLRAAEGEGREMEGIHGEGRIAGDGGERWATVGNGFEAIRCEG